MAAGRHAAKQSFMSRIINWALVALFVFLIIISFFGSWDEWIETLIETIPFGCPIAYALSYAASKILKTSVQYAGSGLSGMTAADIFKDILKLLLATIILSLVKTKPGKRERNEKTFFQNICEKVVVPVVVAFVSSALVEWISDVLVQQGGILMILFIWIGTLGLTFLAVGLFGLFSGKGILWAFGYLVGQVVIVSVLKTVFSYCFILAFLMLLGNKDMWTFALPIMIMTLGCLIMTGAVFGEEGLFGSKMSEYVEPNNRWRF